MTKLLDSLSSGLQAELDGTIRDIETGDQQTYMVHRTSLEMYAFLITWFVTAAEKVKVSEDDNVPAPKAKRGRGGKAGAGKAGGRAAANKKSNETWTWEDQIPNTLKLIAKLLLKVQSQRIWTTTAERDTFIK